MSAFKEGHKKVGGRRKGTLNKLNSSLHDICQQKGLNPFEALLEMANNKETEPGHKLGALKELCEYLYPKRRRVEFDDEQIARVMGEIEALSQLPTKELKRMAQEELDKLNKEPDLDESESET